MEIVAGIVVFNPMIRKFLILQSDYGYDLPKGHVEVGEDIKDGAIRECWEETRLRPGLIPDWYVMLQKGKKEYHFYLGIIDTTTVQLSDEHNHAFWADATFASNLKNPLNIALQTANLYTQIYGLGGGQG
jgi:8-oxo-dGTP pyrophosphatase MutT (NUDIX family)